MVSNHRTLRRVAIAALFATAPVLSTTRAAGIFGTMSNFDVFYSESPQINAYGAEIELEGIHSVDVTTTYPSHFSQITKTDYSSGATFGTHITLTGYNFNVAPPNDFIAYTANPLSTNGHACVNTAGCEHFGFAVAVQPAVSRFYWLDQSSARINPAPLAIPSPLWIYQPPAVVGNPPIVQAVVQVPAPPEVQQQLPDSVWMKVFEIEMDRPVNLDELISAGGVAPEDATEIETEWEFLEGGVQSLAGGELKNANSDSVVRRYEFFKYTGPYKAEDHAPDFHFAGGQPPVDMIGAFISANMVAANLVPEPSTIVLALVGFGALAWIGRGRRRA